MVWIFHFNVGAINGTTNALHLTIDSVKKAKAMTVLDLRKLISPFSLLKASNAFNQMTAGETLEVFWGDRESSSDLLKILPAERCESVSIEKLQDDFSGIRIQIKKKI